MSRKLKASQHSTGRHFIYRAFTGNEILGWESLPPFDGFYLNLQYDVAEQIEAVTDLVARGKRFFRYYTVSDYPYAAWDFGGVSSPPYATWFNWFRDNLQFTTGGATHRRLRVGDLVGLFPWYVSGSQRREVINWLSMTGTERQSIVDEMVELALAPGGTALSEAGIYLDQTWLKLDEWWFATSLTSGHGDTKESQPGLGPLSWSSANTTFGTPTGSWSDWTAAMMDFYDKMQTAMAARGTRQWHEPPYALHNGEHRTVNGETIPMPWHLENAWFNYPIDGATQPACWAQAKTYWAQDKRNVLSLCGWYGVDATYENEGFPNALWQFYDKGGWIGFTDDNSEQGVSYRTRAYQEAARIRAGYSYSNPGGES